ncbi:adenylyl-sulfate kinase [Nodularia harveyana UHCC-0300]|uniref:Adenylyl-sulfate kinase n=1 Tax=Nodularia harveyana UHCC-0300 TaxID=2974287 RepID=A0ABU5U9M5_9CYAN|nr:adenylyl-sulfate kinase [Nodularia harveyana]MEA5580235.1 adenylyl-sulfate kinase [Nodularia harveyana UHCC-0300]
MNYSGFTLWFTGLSGAGKTTISQGVASHLKTRGFPVEILDGDVVRTHLSQGLGFSKEDRDINVRRIGFVASLLSRHQVIVIVSAISPYQKTREEVREMTKNFVEVYVKASLDTCEKRDVKGLYAKARNGEIKQFTGIDDPYEEPVNPEIICNTEDETVDKSITKVMSYLKQMGYLSIS